MDELVVLGYLLTYISDTLAGAGALKGKNCTIQSITQTATGAEVVFLWTLDDGTEQTDTLTIANGRDGVSVTHSWNGTTLTVTSASGTTSADLKGDPGVTPQFTPGAVEVLPYGSTPQITITGTAANPVLNIAWPEGKPGGGADYELPIANSARLGGVKIGNGFTMDADGTLHNAAQSPDLSDYYKRTETNTLLAKKVDAVAGKQLSTEDYTAEEKAKLAALANYDDTALKQGLDGKVDKEAGKGLSTNDYTTEEKTKLASLQNYDDTALTQAVEGKVDKEAGKGLSTNDFTTEEKTKLASLQNYDDTALVQAVEGKVDKVEGMGLSHNDLTDELLEKINAASKSMQLKTRVDTADDLPADPAVGDTYFVGLEGASEFEQYTYTESGWLNTGTTSADLAKYLLKDEATTLLAGKVDKVDGKGLSTNDYTTEEKTKLAGLANYDDTGIREELGKKVDAVAGKGLSTNDYTTAEKEKLAGLANYDDTAIKEALSKKVDAADGMGLSSNDYTTAEKEKLAGLTNYDDTALRTALDGKVDKEEGKGLFSGSYNDLTEKPEIPQNLTDYATKQYVDEHIAETAPKDHTHDDLVSTDAMNTALAQKVDKVLGKQLSTEDFTSELKEKLENALEIDDTTTSTEKVWSSSKVDRAKLNYAYDVHMVNLGFTRDSTVDLADFLAALIKKYGNFAYINIHWGNAFAANVTDGTTTVYINSGVLILSGSVGYGDFPDGIWSTVTAIYCPGPSSTNALPLMYKLVVCVEGTAGTVVTKKIYRYWGQPTADVAATTITPNTAVFQAGDGHADWYMVRNGVCYVNIDFIGVATGEAAFVLPKPAVTAVLNFPISSYNAAEVGGVLVLSPSGNVAAYNIVAGARYFANFSYPVA